jgi:hypothetical protein
MSTYIDVRGPWPLLVIGERTYVVEGGWHDISIAQAIEVIHHRTGELVVTEEELTQIYEELQRA